MQGQLEKEKNTVLDYWQEGLEILSQRIGPDKDIFNIGIFSRQWEIRNFNNSTKNSLV
jgi:DNA repair exonuclease SbcCD ATPase subunit